MNKQARIIKKYGNRRLYDTEESRYVNLERVAGLVRAGEAVTVIDATTGEDLTRQVLTQIIVESARDPQQGAPIEFLRDLIRTSDHAQREFLQWYLRSAAQAYHKMQVAWSERAAWPPSPAQWEAWLRRWDPLSLFQSMVLRETARRVGSGEADGDRESQEEVSGRREGRQHESRENESRETGSRETGSRENEELRELRERLSALERQLSTRRR